MDAELCRLPQIAVVKHVLQRAAACNNCDEHADWVRVIKCWARADVTTDAVRSWFDDMQIATSSNCDSTARVIAEIIILNLVDPHELETCFKDGKFHPLFFLVLKRLYNAKGIIYIQRNFGES